MFAKVLAVCKIHFVKVYEHKQAFMQKMYAINRKRFRDFFKYLVRQKIDGKMASFTFLICICSWFNIIFSHAVFVLHWLERGSV